MAFRATASQKRLEEAGFEPKMAHAQAAAMEEFVISELVTREYLDAKLSEAHSEFKGELSALRAEVKGDLATLRSELKGDLGALRSELKGDLGTLRGDLRAEIAAAETRLIRWMVGTVGGAALAMILTLMRVMR
jgi:hypothetical protein